MEKFSAFRDPGTGIQPFLPLVPPAENDPFTTLLLPVRGVLAILRIPIFIITTLLYCLLHYSLFVILAPIPPLRRLLTGLCTSLLARIALYTLGFIHIREEIVARKRGPESPWRPRAGDIIVSNWTSWIDVLWIAYRFNPIFVMPIVDEPVPSVLIKDAPPTSAKAGRNKPGLSASSTPTRSLSSRSPIKGFRLMSLFSMILAAGRTPRWLSSRPGSPLEELRLSAQRPIVVFPECTTSNGRGLLRFADVFEGISVPTKQFNVFIMCIRYDPPDRGRPSPSHPIPSPSLNPLRHFSSLLSSLPPYHMSVRMLPLSESPSSQLFMVSEVTTEPMTDVLSEVCSILMARIGKVKRTRFGWEDKVAFLDFYWSRHASRSTGRP